MTEKSLVAAIPAAASPAALAHFEASFAYETDCWDVHDALAGGKPDFVLLDVRGTEKYAAGMAATRDFSVIWDLLFDDGFMGRNVVIGLCVGQRGAGMADYASLIRPTWFRVGFVFHW